MRLCACGPGLVGLGLVVKAHKVAWGGPSPYGAYELMTPIGSLPRIRPSPRPLPLRTRPPLPPLQGVGPDIEVPILEDMRERFIIDSLALYVQRDGCAIEQVGACAACACACCGLAEVLACACRRRALSWWCYRAPV